MTGMPISERCFLGREMAKLQVDMYDHGLFMHGVTELLEDILGRGVSELENPLRLLEEARTKVNALYANINLAQPVANECHCEACWQAKQQRTK